MRMRYPLSNERRIINPATEETMATVADSTSYEVHEAVERAAAAQRTWAALAPADRARLLRRFAAAVDGEAEQLARLEVEEAGHTLGNARWEAGNVRDLLDYAAGEWNDSRAGRSPFPAESTSPSSNPSASSA